MYARGEVPQVALIAAMDRRHRQWYNSRYKKGPPDYELRRISTVTIYRAHGGRCHGADQSPKETATWRHPVPAARLLAQLPNAQIEKLGNHFEQAVWNKRFGQQGDPQAR